MKRSWSVALLFALLLSLVVPATVVAQDGEIPAFLIATVRSRSGSSPIRAEADLSSEVLANLDNGTVVEVLAEGDSWTQVRYEDVEGWMFTANLTISLNFLNLDAALLTNTDLAIRADKDISAEVVDVAPDNGTVGVIYVDGLWAYVYTGSAVGWTFTRDLTIEPDNDYATNFLQDTAVVVSRSGETPIRTATDISADVVGTVAANETVNVLFESEDGLWSYVLYHGLEGWMFSARLNVVGPRAYGTGATNELRINLRSAADTSDPDNIIRQLDLEEEVLLIGRSEDGSFLFVRAGADQGWVSAQFVTTEYDVTTLPVR